MEINRRFRIVLAGSLALMLADCVGPPARTPAPQPAPAPQPVRQTAPRPAPAVGWRDAELTAGTWSYRTAANGSAAVFESASGAPLLWLRCDSAARVVTLARASQAGGSGAVPLSLATTSMARTVSTTADAGPPAAVMARFPATDPALDAIAFSRGRFSVDVAGQPMLVLPAWSETARVVEDCR